MMFDEFAKRAMWDHKMWKFDAEHSIAPCRDTTKFDCIFHAPFSTETGLFVRITYANTIRSSIGRYDGDNIIVSNESSELMSWIIQKMNITAIIRYIKDKGMYYPGVNTFISMAEDVDNKLHNR